MVKFHTEKLEVKATPQQVEFYGKWRKRGSERLFSNDQIRRIRQIKNLSNKSIADIYNCSATLIYYIRKGAIYSDVI